MGLPLTGIDGALGTDTLSLNVYRFLPDPDWVHIDYRRSPCPCQELRA